jgi:hypothetical protein
MIRGYALIVKELLWQRFWLWGNVVAFAVVLLAYQIHWRAAPAIALTVVGVNLLLAVRQLLAEPAWTIRVQDSQLWIRLPTDTVVLQRNSASPRVLVLNQSEIHGVKALSHRVLTPWGLIPSRRVAVTVLPHSAYDLHPLMVRQEVAVRSGSTEWLAGLVSSSEIWLKWMGTDAPSIQDFQQVLSDKWGLVCDSSEVDLDLRKVAALSPSELDMRIALLCQLGLGVWCEKLLEDGLKLSREEAAVRITTAPPRAPSAPGRSP